jgi:hypothetical protein
LFWFLGKIYDKNKETKAILDNLSEAVITITNTELNFSNRVADELLDKVRELSDVDNFLDAKVFKMQGD